MKENRSGKEASFHLKCVFLLRQALLLCVSASISFSQNLQTRFKTPVFENISIEDGLPENNVTCILQDYLGFLWLGTDNGLAKYDGYKMEVFQPDENKAGSISGSEIATIYEDENRTLWIGTVKGLNRFDRTNESFASYRFNPEDTSSVSSDQIHCIYEDKAGRFWVGTAEGLNLFDRNNAKFTRYYFAAGDSKSRTTPGKYNLCVNAISEDPVSGDLLIGTEVDGLWRFNVNRKTFSKYVFDSDRDPAKKIGMIQSFCKSRDGKVWMASFNSLSSLDPQKREFKSYINFPMTSVIWSVKPDYINGTVIEDRHGLIWCGFATSENGIFCVDPQTGYSRQYQYFPGRGKESGLNKTIALYQDRSGIIWIGTYTSGVEKWDRSKNKIGELRSDPNDPHSPGGATVGDVIYDPRGFMWLGTKAGLYKYDPEKGTFRHYLRNEKSITQAAYTIALDNSGIIWIATSYDGMLRFNPADESYKYCFNNPHDSMNLIDKKVLKIVPDYLGSLWICTFGYGLYKIDVASNKVTRYRHVPGDSSSLVNDFVGWVFEDHTGTIWVAAGGLDKFDRQREKFSYCGFKGIDFMFEDRKGNFWLTDYYLGLCLYDRKRNAVVASYGQKDALPSTSTSGILEDGHGNLWVGTFYGLTRFNTATKSFRTYYKEDGLPSNAVIKRHYSMGPNGTMYFATTGGMVTFHPDSIKDDPVPPQVVLTDVSLFNRPGEKPEYDGFISELKELTLPYDRNDLRFDFVGLQFSEPARNRYKYILEHFDNGWIDAGHQRYATYTNLDPGEYVFRVTASNRDGVWNGDGVSIRIIITPPWWRTVWAYAAYLFFIVGILYSGYRVRLRQLRLEQAAEMERFQRERLAEVDRLKSRFFTNISHEFRTPLTLILGPVKQIADKMEDEKIRDELRVAYRNARRLLQLVNQLLDISRLEAGTMKLHAVRQNIIPLLRAFVSAFSSYAERKRISLRFNATEDEIMAYIDKEIIEKIITNILSNALKFTPEGGLVEVSVSKNEEQVDVQICDTGIGIPKDEIPKIFDRFYQVNGSHTRAEEGTGIGLALAKELIELHKCSIGVESEVGKGTTVTVSIPLGTKHLRPEEMSEPVRTEEEAYHPEMMPASVAEERIGEAGVVIPRGKKPAVLIVEDNDDMRRYIGSNLEQEYTILEARDGEDGWNKSTEFTPDMIVTDVMMPKMDGFELCRRIKSDERTSHIPVILLTAKAAGSDKMEGLETGADDYIMKPFEHEELKARIRNLIEQRKRIHEHFRKKGILELNDLQITPVDRKFLEKVFHIIEENIPNTSFSVESLAEIAAVSRAFLHKKVVSLTGEPPVELIRRMRLTRAAQLLEKKGGNISEIAFEVGFSNPAYFSECFKKQFGVSPSHYHHSPTDI